MPSTARGLALTPDVINAIAAETAALGQAVDAMRRYVNPIPETRHSFGAAGEDVGRLVADQNQELIDALGSAAQLVTELSVQLDRATHTVVAADADIAAQLRAIKGNIW